MKRQFREPSEETRRKQSAQKSGVNNPMWGKTHSEATKILISKKLKAHWDQVPSKNNKLKIT